MKGIKPQRPSSLKFACMAGVLLFVVAALGYDCQTMVRGAVAAAGRAVTDDDAILLTADDVLAHLSSARACALDPLQQHPPWPNQREETTHLLFISLQTAFIIARGRYAVQQNSSAFRVELVGGC